MSVVPPSQVGPSQHADHIAAQPPVLEPPAAKSWLKRLGLLVFLAVAGGSLFAISRFVHLGASAEPAPKTSQRVIPVITATVAKGDLNIYLTSLGTVTAYNTVTVRSRVDGELMTVAFTEGQFVHEGDLLAQIDPRTYEVKVAQAEGQMARDEANLKNARLDLDRDKKLVAAKAAAQQQLDAGEATVSQLEGALKSDKAQVDDAKLQLTYCRITAPIGGRVGLRRVDKGNLVQANDPMGLAVITQLEPIAVVFTVPQDEIFRVQSKSGSKEKLIVEAYNRDFRTRLATGSLEAIDNQVDPATGTVRLKAVFSNEDHALFPNQFVNARLLIDTRRDALLVPTAAVQHGPNSTFSYVVKPDRTVELRDVVAGPTEADQVIIESGLAAGEVVVTEGIDKLQPGSKVLPGDKQRGKGHDEVKSRIPGKDRA